MCQEAWTVAERNHWGNKITLCQLESFDSLISGRLKSQRLSFFLRFEKRSASNLSEELPGLELLLLPELPAYACPSCDSSFAKLDFEWFWWFGSWQVDRWHGALGQTRDEHQSLQLLSAGLTLRILEPHPFVHNTTYVCIYIYTYIQCYTLTHIILPNLRMIYLSNDLAQVCLLLPMLCWRIVQRVRSSRQEGKMTVEDDDSDGTNEEENEADQSYEALHQGQECEFRNALRPSITFHMSFPLSTSFFLLCILMYPYWHCSLARCCVCQAGTLAVCEDSARLIEAMFPVEFTYCLMRWWWRGRAFSLQAQQTTRNMS